MELCTHQAEYFSEIKSYGDINRLMHIRYRPGVSVVVGHEIFQQPSLVIHLR